MVTEIQKMAGKADGGGGWSSLPIDLLLSISKLLNNVVDNVSLRSVCSSWRSYVPPLNSTTQFPLQLPHHPSFIPNHTEQITCLSQSTIYFIQPKPITTASPPPWLIRLQQTHTQTPIPKFHPLNPLSKIMTCKAFRKPFPQSINLLNFHITEISKAYTLEYVDPTKTKNQMHILTRKVAVCLDYAVIAVMNGKLWFVKFGDDKWSLVHDPENNYYDDCLYYKGRFYAVDRDGRAVLVGSDFRVEEEDIAASIGGGGGQYKQLVESCGDLFLVDKHLYYEQQAYPEKPIDFKVYKLNEEKRQWELVQSLGDRVFFVGEDCSFWFFTKDFSGLKRDCIYGCDYIFGDDSEEHITDISGDTGFFTLEDGSCGPLASFPDLLKIFWPPPAWIKPKVCAMKK